MRATPGWTRGRATSGSRLCARSGASRPTRRRRRSGRSRAIEGAGNRHATAELARYRRRIRTLTARGGERHELLALLHPRGAADYARFVRKHRHYHAPTLEGAIEAGVSHVHPALSPFGPPPAARFEEINRSMLRRAGDREAAYARWAIGEPYEGRETHTVRVRFGRPVGVPARRLLGRTAVAAPGRGSIRRLAAIPAAAAGFGAVALLVRPEAIGLALAGGAATTAAAWIARSAGRELRRLRPSDALEDFGAAVAQALAATGVIAPALGPAAVRVGIHDDGYYRCWLVGADEAESRIFAEALDELLSPLASPRYIIPRYVADAPRSAAGTLLLLGRLTLTGRPGDRVVYHAVPAFLAVNRKRVDAFRSGWHQRVSPGEPIFWKDPRAEAVLEVQRGEDPFVTETQMRVVWQ